MPIEVEDHEALFARYQRLQAYVGWSDADVRHVLEMADFARPVFPELVDDFYRALLAQPATRQVIRGGEEQIERLKVSLAGWLEEFFSGRYDDAYVARRWRVGWRHVEIGLDQVYTNAALSRLRAGLLHAVGANWAGDHEHLLRLVQSFNKLIDLDLAIIEDAYQSEFNKRRSRALLNAIPDTILRISRAGQFLDVRMHRDREHAPDLNAAIGGDLRDSQFPPNVIEQFLPAIERALNQEAPQTFEFTLPIVGGRQQFEVRVVKSSDDEVVALIRDVTEHRRAEERLLQAERLAAIGQTVAGLAHESRNAFQRSQACLEMLAMEIEDRPEALELVGKIQKAQDHLHRLYEEVRNYAAPIHLQTGPCDLAQVWRNTWANLELARRDKQMHIRERRGCADVTCQGDADALEQVFRNIFENAIVACPEPGEIVVSFRDARLEQRPAIATSIRDNGPGIPPSVRAHIFDPFFTTKVKGTGLGMAIARRIIEAHGGQISVIDHDGVGDGAEIVFILPRPVRATVSGKALAAGISRGTGG